MTLIGGRWRVHDVVIDGVSLVDNYAAQFTRVLRTAAFPQLVERLRAIAGTDSGGMAAIDELDAPTEAVMYFAASRADVSAGMRRELHRVAAQAVNRQDRVVVEGHADGRGDIRSNDVLAEQRAEAIRDHLISEGLNANRIVVVGYGDRRPVCQDQTQTCWALNRRAEVRFAP
jgi:outer membrane protein OmpA-like peptidoglycan-associated protein